MKKVSLFLIGLLIVPSLFLSSCDRGDDNIDVVAEPAFTRLTSYMESNNLDLNNILVNLDGKKFVTKAPNPDDLQDFLNSYYIIDIRSADAFNAGHIQSAKNVAFGDILTEAPNANGQPILVVCYTGQTACYATSLLRLYGYPSTQALKWGMSGWNQTTAGPWDSNIGDEANGHSNWSYSAPPSNISFEDPELAGYTSSGENLLRARVEEVVAAGFKGVNGTDVLNSPGSYFINNYFNETDYNGFGHIANAYRILPLLLSDDSYSYLNPQTNAQVVTYCYTGQTSAVITAYLRVLGYDAYSMKFGMNGIFNSNPQWSTNQWGGDSHPKDLGLE
ncbi:MAG: rhodanese-like domain-containing protein [Bacteroidia bacterium]|nr:rhodanese-like domain-containing protein [Bacteroidia bacterium]MBT8269531.1 rhodanese-like domain-containing protein [Bacteroidia bacterium]NNK69786.1 rhodanese-like domain-containing protein [Flavobacteriaceae bacterium]NNL80440.1 rhodanese-like domain-containing protein [Flavobacteriaceae bacterium]